MIEDRNNRNERGSVKTASVDGRVVTRRALIGTDDANDIAILRLDRPVDNVTPSPLFHGTPSLGSELTLVGFGPREGDNQRFGTKRVGTTPIDGVSSTLITWTFDGSHEATTVRGDSGSPQFIYDGGVYYLASIASGGTLNDTYVGDFAYNTRVDAYFDWIATVIAE
jgi:hypothetical protein